ncbi:MAG: hypothetical protein C0524_06265 [Rhodobacter sp.]|nr:hypothetical protein [Rhodobacter sp.]
MPRRPFTAGFTQPQPIPEAGIVAANAVMLTGSQMMYDCDDAAPQPRDIAEIRLQTRNMSARMDNMRAALPRPQLATLADNVTAWHARYERVAAGLAT